MAIARVGLSPLHSVNIPSFRAIFRNPSSVVVNVRLCVSSAAQSEAIAAELSMVAAGEATQNWDWFCTQNTSRQQAVMPRFGGSSRKGGRRAEFSVYGVGVEAWRRTRTTSKGVTEMRSVRVSYNSSHEVMYLKET